MARFKRQEKPFKKANAILCADLHIRPDTPICRTDDFFAAMERKIDFILELSKQHECPILEAGDFGNYPLNWPTWLLEWAIKRFKGHNIVITPGQHDLPNHRLDLWETSGIGVLEAAGVIEVAGIITIEDKISVCHFSLKSTIKHGFEVFPFPYGSHIHSLGLGTKYEMPTLPTIAMAHMMVIENKPLWPGQDAPKGHQLLKKFPEYNLILTGDNHNPFTAEYEGRILVNPGSMMRTTAAQIDHRPRVYLWWADTNKIEVVYLPIEDGKKVISRVHIDVAKERTTRMDAFVTRVRNDVEIKLSYENNIANYFEKYRTQKQVKEKVLEAIG